MSSCIVRRCSCFGSLRQPYSLLIIIFFKVTPARLWVYDSPVKPVGELFGYLLFSSTMWHSFEIHMAAFLPQILVDSVNRTSLPWWAAIMVGLVGWSPSQKFIWWHGELNKSTAPAMEEAWFRCFSIVHHVKLSPVTSICVCVTWAIRGTLIGKDCMPGMVKRRFPNASVVAFDVRAICPFDPAKSTGGGHDISSWTWL